MLNPSQAIFAGHLHPELAVGHVGFAPAVSNAASDNIEHSPDGQGRARGTAASSVSIPSWRELISVTQLQSIISRSLAATDSAVLTIGSFHAGTARNIIPQEAVLEGTLRTLNPEVRERVLCRLKEMLEGSGDNASDQSGAADIGRLPAVGQPPRPGPVH